MSKIKTLGTRLSKCPKCGEELFDFSYEEGYRQKECVTCNLIFKKKKGPYFRWRMGTVEDFIREEINRI